MLSSPIASASIIRLYAECSGSCKIFSANPGSSAAAIRVFRDESSLSASPALWPANEKALEVSRYFIICASPEAAASEWVNKEVRWWLEKKSRATFLIALMAGQLDWDAAGGDFVWSAATPLPPACKGAFHEMPKWVDFRFYRGFKGNSKHDAFLGLTADLSAESRGLPKDDLLSEEVRQQRRRLQLAYPAAGGLASLAIVAGILANRAIVARSETETTARNAANSASTFVYNLFGGCDKPIAIDPARKLDLLDNASSLLDSISALRLSNILVRCVLGERSRLSSPSLSY